MPNEIDQLADREQEAIEEWMRENQQGVFAFNPLEPDLHEDD